MKEKAKLEEEKKDEEKEDPKGIPEFWLTVFKNVDLLSDMVQVGDVPGLFEVVLVLNPSLFFFFKERSRNSTLLDVSVGKQKWNNTWMSSLVLYSTESTEQSEIPSYCIVIC